MSEASDLHRAMLDTATRRDWEGLRGLLHDDTDVSGDGQEMAGPDVGVEVPRTYLEAFPDLNFEIRHLHACGDDTSILEMTARGTHQGTLEGIAPTGRSLEVLVCDVIEVRDGKIHREREYYDSMSLMQQLGVVPETTTA